jgi:SPP1 family predicted phage head-tail adaptor
MPMNPQARGTRMVKVTIVKSVGGQDSLGGVVQTPTNYAAPWAQIVTLRGQELAAAQQINAQVNTRITVRYAEVKSALEDGTLMKMYVLYRGTYYDIQWPGTPEQRDQWVDLYCVARIGQGANFK